MKVSKDTVFNNQTILSNGSIRVHINTNVFDQRVAVTHGLDEGQYDQCYACRHPLSPEELESDQYTKGISCPYCFNKLSDKKRAGVIERQKQIKLSKSKGKNHIGDNQNNGKEDL